MNTTPKINFYLRDVNSKTETTIFLSLYYGSKQVKLSTKINVKPRNWDLKKQRFKSSATNSRNYNKILNDYIDIVHEAHSNIFFEKPDANKLKQEIIKLLDKKRNSDKSIIEYYDDFVNSKTIKETTQKYQTLKMHLSKYLNKTKLGSLEELNLGFMNSFVDFLFDSGLQNRTIKENSLKALNSFLKWTVDNDHNSNKDYQKYKFPYPVVDSPIIYMTDKELNALYRMKIKDNQALEEVRDLFLLECYTALRYSDIKLLSKEAIQGNTLHVTPVKTARTVERLKIPIVDNAKAIFNKYKSHPDFTPKVSHTKINKLIKRLCFDIKSCHDMVEIEYYIKHERIVEKYPKYSKISSHTGRRTFITLSLQPKEDRPGVRPEVVMKITGHKDYRTFQKYIKLAYDQTEKELLDRWNNQYY